MPHLVLSYFSHFQMSGFRALGIDDRRFDDLEYPRNGPTGVSASNSRTTTCADRHAHWRSVWTSLARLRPRDAGKGGRGRRAHRPDLGHDGRAWPERVGTHFTRERIGTDIGEYHFRRCPCSGTPKRPPSANAEPRHPRPRDSEGSNTDSGPLGVTLSCLRPAAYSRSLSESGLRRVGPHRA